MKIISKFLAGVMVLGILAIQTSSEAEEYTFPGANCVAEHASNSFVTFGNLYNTYTGTDSAFTCPIARRAPDSSSITYLYAIVDDEGVVSLNNDGNVCCTARSCDDSGATCNVSASVCSSGVGIQTLALASVGGLTDGYAYIRCIMGSASKGQSGVMSYIWND